MRIIACVDDLAQAAQRLRPDRLVAVAVLSRVNRPANDDAALLEPMGASGSGNA
jgi:hypothetical protein